MGKFWIFLLASCLSLYGFSQAAEEEDAFTLTVLSGSGEPVEGAEVAVIDALNGVAEPLDAIVAARKTGPDGKVELNLDKSLRRETIPVFYVQSATKGTALVPLYQVFMPPDVAARSGAVPDAVTRTGVVRDLDGAPVAGVAVMPILGTPGFGNALSVHLAKALTDSGGRFEVKEYSGTGAGSGLFFYKKDVGVAFWGEPGRDMTGMEPFGLYPPVPGTPQSEMPVQEPSQQAQEPKELEIVLQAGVSLRGKVVDWETGEGIPDAKVTVRSNVPMIMLPAQAVRTGTDGGYELRNTVFPEYCSLYAEKEGLFGEYLATQAGEPGSAKEVRSLKMGPLCVVRGQILDEATRKPLSEREVDLEVRREDFHPGDSLSAINADGTFELRTGPGLVTVVAGGVNCDVVKESQEHRLILERTYPIDGIEIRTRSWQPLKGRVLLPDGAPAVGAAVRVTCEREAAIETQTDARGEFEAPLPAPCLCPEKPFYRTISCEARLEGDRPMLGVYYVALESPEEAQCEFTAHPLTSVTGTLVDEAGVPKANEPVHGSERFQPRKNRFQSHTYAKAVTDAEGRFTLENCPAGPELMLGGTFYPERATGQIAGTRITLKAGETNIAPPLKWIEMPEDNQPRFPF